MPLVLSSMALHTATTVLSKRSPQEKSQTPILDRSFFEIVARGKREKFRPPAQYHNAKKSKDKHFLISDVVLAQLPTRKLRSRIAAPNGAVTGTGQPRPCNLTCNGACCVGPSGSVQEKVCPSAEDGDGRKSAQCSLQLPSTCWSQNRLIVTDRLRHAFSQTQPAVQHTLTRRTSN